MTNITAEHRAAFEALTSADFENFALYSCFVNGEPAAAIVAINRDENAPIFASADLGVVGDALTIVPKLTEELKRRKG